jgi:hypothetical protein
MRSAELFRPRPLPTTKACTPTQRESPRLRGRGRARPSGWNQPPGPAAGYDCSIGRRPLRQWPIPQGSTSRFAPVAPSFSEAPRWQDPIFRDVLRTAARAQLCPSLAPSANPPLRAVLLSRPAVLRGRLTLITLATPPTCDCVPKHSYCNYGRVNALLRTDGKVRG